MASTKYIIQASINHTGDVTNCNLSRWSMICATEIDTPHSIYDRLHAAPECVMPTVETSSSGKPNTWTVLADDLFEKPVVDFMPVFKHRFIFFTCKTEHLKQPDTINSKTNNLPNAFDKLMAKNTALPKSRTGTTKKDELFNKLLDQIKDDGITWFATDAETEGGYILTVLTNALWYVTNQHLTIQDAVAHGKGVLPIPEEFSNYQGFNDFKRKRIKEQPMESNKLHTHSQSLLALCARPGMNIGKKIMLTENIKQLALSMESYANYLDNMKNGQAKRQKQDMLVRQVSHGLTVELREAASKISPKYSLLDEVLLNSELYKPMKFSESEHVPKPLQPLTAIQSHRFREDIHLSVPITLLKYCPGGSHYTICYLWKVRDLDSRDQQEELTTCAKIALDLERDLPVFHSRQMKSDWKKKYSNISHISPSIMEAIYSDLTLDSSAPDNAVMQQRIQLALSEPDIIPDLRHLNPGRPGDAFAVFWDNLTLILNEVTAADERRHGTSHMSEWISLADLVKTAAEKCPPNTPIPSVALVRLQFTPRNPYTNRALNFTSRLNIQYKVQVRQLRASHPDAHFCAAQFRYLRERLVQLSGKLSAFFVDDKAKIPVGKPDCPVSTGVRSRPSLAPVTSKLNALDHDMTNVSITPSVILDVDIPSDVEKSWCNGDVTVILQDSIFEPSTSYRFAATTLRMLREKQEPPKIFVKYSDGAADHRNLLVKVQLAHIAVFKILNLDMMVLARCAPGQSWLNPVERVHSVLNLALQNCSLARAYGTPDLESHIRSCSSMAEIRRASEKHAEIEAEWPSVLKPVMDILESRFQRLALKNKPIKVCKPVTEEVIAEITSKIVEMFPAIEPATVQKSQAMKCLPFTSWMERHCRSRQYILQIRKCEEVTCCPAPSLDKSDMQWIPDPVLKDDQLHYKPLNDVLGKQDTNDLERPSLLKKNKTKQHALDYFMMDEKQNQQTNTSLFTAQNARLTLTCAECDKPRVIYGKQHLSSRHQLQLTLIISETDYTCGCVFLSSEHPLSSKYQTRPQLNCGDLIETSYYSSKLGRSDVCSYCAKTGAKQCRELLAKFKTVLPICDTCSAKSFKPVCMRPFGKKK